MHKKNNKSNRIRPTVAYFQGGGKSLTPWSSGYGSDMNAFNIEGINKAMSLNDAINQQITSFGPGTMGEKLGATPLSLKAPGLYSSKAPTLPSLPTKTLTGGITDIGGVSKATSLLGSATNIMGGLTGGIAGVSNLFSIANNPNLNADQKTMATADGVVNTIGDVASAFGPVGSLVGGGLKLINSIGGGLIGTPKELKDYKVNDQVAKSSGYTGIAAQGADVGKSNSSYASSGLAGKLFSNKNGLIGKTKSAESVQKFTKGILDSNKLAMDSSATSSGMFGTRNRNLLSNGNMWNDGSVLMGKEGAKLDAKEVEDDKFKKLVKTSMKLPVKKMKLKSLEVTTTVPLSPKNSQPIASFKEGGSINVIVNGALHSQKHELKDNSDFEDAEITHKGIPVVTIAEGGQIEQHAEVERDELILHLEITKKLEALMEEGTDEAAIEAGKLLAEEIINNTKDSKSEIIKNA